MATILKTLGGFVSKAFEDCGYDPAYGVVTVSDRPELAQFQCNGAFAAAKAYKKAPLVIADEVAKRLAQLPAFSKAEAVKPGFINLTLSDNYLLELVNGIVNDEHDGISQPEKPLVIVIDYGGPNVAKPLHIGHLRPAIIGEALKRLARACGHKVISDVHFGDWGLPIGLIITELAERMPGYTCFTDDYKEGDKLPELDIDMLNEVYPTASAKSKEDEAYRNRARMATFELQNGRPGYIALWKEIMRLSVSDVKANYDKLNVDFDYWYGESDADKYIPELMERLSKAGLLRESDGALVVDVAEEDDKAPMPPIIVRKSDNSSAYATTDLATIIQRQKDFAPDVIWYITDSRQGLHFTQVFRCAKKAGLVPPETVLEFLGNGTMNGSDGKPFKTRDGGVMKLSDLLGAINAAAAEKLAASSFVTDDDGTLARRVGLAAIKFGDLINHRSKEYVFDMDKFLSFEGKTGTYLLYTVTRINSILNKTGVAYDERRPVRGVYSDIERELMLKIVLAGQAFEYAMEERAPNYICESAYQLASIFSRFYHDNRIIDELDEAKRNSWLAILTLTRRLLVKHLDVMGIEPVENM